jgi:DNA-directed RNA polymerase subunit L
MELTIVEEEKDKIKFEVKGEGHTFANPISKELWNDSHVKTSGYSIKHSLISNPVFIVETDGIEKPKIALKKASERLTKQMDEILTKFKSIK